MERYNKASLYIICHEHFNKSLTLDIENRLRLYMMSVECVKTVYNKRGNPQNKYYTEIELDIIFQKVFDSLDKKEERQLIFIEGEAGTGRTVI